MDNLAQTVEDIKSLKIQGATNVAKSALKILLTLPDKDILEATEQLIPSRPTEPLLQNCLNLVNLRGKSVIALLLTRLDDIKSEIVKNGLPLIHDGNSILTHCHSSTVVELLTRAKKNGLDFKVYLTETRPLFQGRITAEELVKAEISSTMITDAEAAFLVSKEDNQNIDLVLLGVDAIAPGGGVFNKVGSYGIALAANEAKIPFYVVADLLKFSPGPVVIEERKGEELWEEKPKNLKILNPIFDFIPPEFITGLVCEFGIIKPVEVRIMVKKNYPWIMINKAAGHEFFHSTLSSGNSNNRHSTQADLSKGIAVSVELSKIVTRRPLGSDLSPYKSYLHLNEKINPQTHLVARFLLTTEDGIDFYETAGGVAAESSVGTWTEVTTELKKVWDKLHARVLEADKKNGLLKIAYPLELFEKGNIPQLLSSVAGNIFGLKEVKNLKLLDIELPEQYVRNFPGPAFGAEGIRKFTGVYGRPLIGCIIKPKLGLNPQAHAQVAKEVFDGGVDFVKDDENLTSQEFNPFEKRVSEIIKYLIDSNQLNKIYAFNVTGPTGEMIRRAKLVKENCGNCVMIDFLTAGFSGLQSLRNENLGLIIHGHRAMHAAFDRTPTHGISMLVLAKLARLAGVDSLHSGTVVGKMEGGMQEIKEINQFLLSDWYSLKPVLPVASGGLYPELMPDLIKILGKDVMLNFGGGIHGHPHGSKAGAMAVLAAVEAVQKKNSLLEYAKTHKELASALRHWRKA